MPGDDWQKFANLRLLFGYLHAQAGKKLLFMGGEFGQWREWHHEESLDWHLLEHTPHAGIQRWVKDLNVFYRTEPAMHELDFDSRGFSWIDCADTGQSVISFIRQGRSTDRIILAAFNFTPVSRYNYRLGARVGATGARSLTVMPGSTGETASATWAGSKLITFPPMAVSILLT